MTQDTVSEGKYVSVSYTIFDDEDELVEQHALPVGYVHGSDTQLIGGMDRAIEGKSVGDEVEVLVKPEDGFGQRVPDLTFTDDVDKVPPQFRQLGAEVQMQSENGETKTFYVTKIENGKLTVDGNHPLAGKVLKVVVKIHEIRDATAGEDSVSGIHAVQMPGPSSIN